MVLLVQAKGAYSLLFCLPWHSPIRYNLQGVIGQVGKEATIVTTVLGYHGCQKDFANGVRSGRITLDQWRPSRNAYDWLGEGIYFWESSRTRAHQWAVEQFADQADVLEVEIDLGHCLDLLESTYHEAIRATYRNLRAVYRSQGWLLPKNHKNRHDLDSLVINKFVKFVERFVGQYGIVFQTVRGAFEEGRPLFPGSALRAQAHIQIAVRDVTCLRPLGDPGGRP
jgi:hypothetical protein